MGRAFEFRKARKMKRWSAMSKAFTRIGKDIVIAVKEGGPDPDSNSKLRAVIQNAKSVNMPKDNIDRAIKRASDKPLGNYKEILFEGYAPYGVAILVETATDNNTIDPPTPPSFKGTPSTTINGELVSDKEPSPLILIA